MTHPRLRTFAFVGIVLLAGVSTSALLRWPGAIGEHQELPLVGVALEEAVLRGLPRAARASLEGRNLPPLKDAGSAGLRRVVVSVARSEATALTAAGSGPDLQTALREAIETLRHRFDSASLTGRIKVDVLSHLGPFESFLEHAVRDLEPGLEGVMLGTDRLWLLPDEVRSRGLIKVNGTVRWKRIASYMHETGRATAAEVTTAASGAYARTRYASVVGGEADEGIILFRGNRLDRTLDAASLLGAARAGGDYLLKHQRPDGSFDYIYRPERNVVEDDYNELRHAGTCYALIELHAATGDARYLTGGAKGIDWLLEHRLGKPKPVDSAVDFATVKSDRSEAKLGGAALALLAMLKEADVTGDRSRLQVMRRLAEFLRFQQEVDGRFRSKYSYGEPPSRPFESLYYPGEAILALVRLHRFDGDFQWLFAARRGVDWLIDVRDAGKPLKALSHDHWLLIGLAELSPLANNDPRYLAHAIKIADAIIDAERRIPEPPDWVGSFYEPPRSTPAAIRSEALVAMVQLARQRNLDPDRYLAALERMVRFQLRCQVSPLNAFHVPRPDRAFGGFRRGLTMWELRIDYAQHNLSALLGFRLVTLQVDP